MARQNINVGTNENDGTGDKLRDAMQKVNENFVELYGLTSSETNVDFTPNTITVTNTNGDLSIVPNGTGTLLVASGAVFNDDEQIDASAQVIVKDGSGGNLVLIDPFTKAVGINTTGTTQGLYVAGNLQVTGANTHISSNVVLGATSASLISFPGVLASDIIPWTTSSYSIGSSSKRLNELYATDVNSTTGTIATLTATTANVTTLGSTTATLGNVQIGTDEVNNSHSGQDLRLTVTGSANITTNTNIVVTGLVKANYFQGSAVRNNLTTSVTLTTLSTVYSYLPNASGHQIYLPDPTTVPGAMVRFINRSGSATFDVVSNDSTMIVQVGTNTKVAVTSDGVNWILL